MLLMTQQYTGQPPTKNHLNWDVSGRISKENKLHNLQGPVKTKIQIQPCSKMLKWWWPSIKPNTGLPTHVDLRKDTGCITIKLALLLRSLYRQPFHHRRAKRPRPSKKVWEWLGFPGTALWPTEAPKKRGDLDVSCTRNAGEDKSQHK